jgi:hypothetical protein
VGAAPLSEADHTTFLSCPTSSLPCALTTPSLSPALYSVRRVVFSHRHRPVALPPCSSLCHCCPTPPSPTTSWTRPDADALVGSQPTVDLNALKLLRRRDSKSTLSASSATGRSTVDGSLRSSFDLASIAMTSASPRSTSLTAQALISAAPTTLHWRSAPPYAHRHGNNPSGEPLFTQPPQIVPSPHCGTPRPAPPPPHTADSPENGWHRHPHHGFPPLPCFSNGPPAQVVGPA